MCKVLRKPVDVTIHIDGANIPATMRGTANIEVVYRNNEIVAFNEDGFTKQQLDFLANCGAYPGTTLDTPVLVTANGGVYYGFQVAYDVNDKEQAQ